MTQCILLLGADGFIGQHLATALRAHGHAVVAGVRQPSTTDDIGVDFLIDHDPAVWQARLHGIDTVINAVGLFRASDEDYTSVHVTAPRALYAACHEAGIRRVVLISALGASPQGETAYWRSKAAGEVALQASGVPWTIVRPGLVYGPAGASSQLFSRLGSLPLLALPAAGPVQPIHIEDLAAGCAALVDIERSSGMVYEATGPTMLALADYLRLLAGRPRGRVLRLPGWLAMTAARALERWPSSLLSRDSLTMLARGSHGDGSAFAALLNRPLCSPASFNDAASRWALQRWQIGWLLRGALAFVWLATAWVSLFVYPVASSHQLLAACGLPNSLFEPLRIGAAGLDAVFGVLTLLRPGRRLWRWQLALIASYSALVALCLPEFLAHPFGPLTKNAALLAALAALLILEETTPCTTT